MVKAMPRASRIPNATHNRTAPPLVQEEGGEDTGAPGVGVESGDIPEAAGVDRGERSLLDHVPRSHNMAATTSTSADANTNHNRGRRYL